MHIREHPRLGLLNIILKHKIFAGIGARRGGYVRLLGLVQRSRDRIQLQAPFERVRNLA